jgi:hypothetical protein
MTGTRLQLGGRETKNSFPGRIETLEIAVESGRAEQVAGHHEPPRVVLLQRPTLLDWGYASRIASFYFVGALVGRFVKPNLCSVMIE